MKGLYLVFLEFHFFEIDLDTVIQVQIMVLEFQRHNYLLF